MKQRIKYIFLLMSFCILGIILFQFYWLNSSYRLKNQQFVRDATEALFQTTRRLHVIEAEQFFKDDTSKNRLNESYERSLNFSEEVPSFFLGFGSDRPEPRRRPFIQFRRRIANPADSMAREITDQIIFKWNQNDEINLKRLDSIFNKELYIRNIDTEYKLDTIRLADDFLDIRFHPVAGTAEWPVKVRPVPLNPVKNIFLEASFKSPASYIFNKMKWLLGFSFLLLGLTTACFIYMLNTILQQKKLSEIKNDFINNITHELKTPIATVAAAVEAMQSFGALDDEEKTRLYLSVSRSQLGRLSDLVEKVLDLAVEEKHELVLQPEKLDIHQIINEITAHLSLKSHKKVCVQTNIDPNIKYINADKLHFTNALQNLIDNSIKYSHDKVEIQICIAKTNGYYKISVKDNGIGIAKSYHPMVFDKFFRVPTGNEHSVKGFGLGLSYVKQIAEKHKGRIELLSDHGQGSEFILWIPIKL